MLRCNTAAPVQITSLKWNFEKLLLVTCSPTKVCFAVYTNKKGWISPVLRCLWWLAFHFVQSNNAWQVAWFHQLVLRLPGHTCDFQYILTGSCTRFCSIYHKKLFPISYLVYSVNYLVCLLITYLVYVFTNNIPCL